MASTASSGYGLSMEDAWFSCGLVALVAAFAAHWMADTFLVSIPVFVAAFVAMAWYTAEHG